MAQSLPAGNDDRLRNIEELLVALGNRQMAQDASATQTDILRMIARYKPPYYKGQEDPAVLEDWIRSFDKIYAATHFTDGDKVTAATYYLEGIADVWWQNESKIMEDMPDYSWEELKEDLRKRFYSASTRQAKLEEFMRLRQGLMTVQEYYVKFTELERFAPMYANNEEQRAQKFEIGLNPSIRQALGGKTFTELQKVYDRAVNIDRLKPTPKDKEPRGPTSEDRRTDKRPRFDNRHQGGQAKKRFNNNNYKPKDQAPQRNTPPCPKCKKWHTSQECRIECYYCGKPGHVIRDCYKKKRDDESAKNRGTVGANAPKEQGRGGRLNVVSQAEAERQTDVITGTFQVKEVPVFVLFDTGATCSFIASLTAKKLQLVNSTNIDLSIALPNGELVKCRQLYHDIPLNIEDHIFPSELVAIDLKEFDIILGMDWMSKYKTQVDCLQHKITLKTLKGKRVSYYQHPEKERRTKLVDSVKLNSMVQKGYSVYLCTVQNTKKEGPSLDEIPIANQYPDVFPDEISGMPPPREIEFTIELVPGTEPISKPPY